MADSVITATVDADDGSGVIRRVIGTLVVGAGDYAAGGLAVRAAILAQVPGQGPNSVLQIDVRGIAGYQYEYVKSSGKLQIRQGAGIPAHTHDLHLNNADVADGATTRINAGNNLLGANTGADLLITGLAAGATGGRGGILGTTSTPAALAELPVAPTPGGVTGDVITFDASFKKYFD